MRRRITGTKIGAILLLLSSALGAQATEPAAFRTKFPRELIDRQPALVCARVDKGPTIDGEVDRDPVWSLLPANAHTEGAWSQIARKEASGRQTVVYSCFDKENLYFAFVCEEPELQNVQMDGAIASSALGQFAGPDDCVEAVFEVCGIQGDGEVYSFRANQRARQASGGLAGNPGYAPEWKSAGKFGPNCWMLEMAIPFASFKKRPDHKGLSTPLRGDVLGLKLVRWGAQQQDPRNRMVSTWNTDIAFTIPYIAGCNGLLYFEDSSALRDGALAAWDRDLPWERKGEIAKVPSGGISLAKGASIGQTADVRPNSFYLISVEGEGPLEVTVDGKSLALTNGHWGFWSGEKQDKAVVTLLAAEPARLKKVTMSFQPGEEPPGPYCLTGNYRHPERNIRSVLPDAPDGRYQYVILDYQNRPVGDENPAINKNHWAFDYNLRIEDVGGRAGWIPFSKGSLTVRPEPVFWQTGNPGDGAAWGRHDHALDVDLGQEYCVRGLDILMPAPNALNFEVWGKKDAADEWTYLFTDDGQFVEPSKRRGFRRAYESIRGLDSVVRYLRWRVTQSRGDWVYPQMDGIQKFRVWGEPKGEHAGIKPFQPWISNVGAAPVKWTTTAPDPDICQIIPRPRSMVKTDGWFVIGSQTRIMAQPEAEARRVAKQIQEEIQDRWQIEVPVMEAPSQAGARLDDVIYVGQPGLDATAERLRQEEGLTIANRPQAYALRVSPRGMIVLGNDSQGLYWGVQSMMLAMRWHSSKDPKQNGLGVHCVKIEDWPATLNRSLLYTEWTCFASAVSEIPRLMRNFHLQARFKANAVYSDAEGHRVDISTTLSERQEAEICRQVRERYHLEVRPMLLDNPVGHQGWQMMVHASNNTRLVENNPDEGQAELAGLPCVNLCPMNPKTYDLAFSRLDALLENYGWPRKIWLDGLVYASPQGGSRWGICRDCRRSGKNKDELFAFFAGKIAQRLRERHVTGVLEPSSVAFGDRDDPKWKQALVVADLRSLPGDFEYVLPNDGSQRFMDFIKATRHPSSTANGPLNWPAGERISGANCPSDAWTISGGIGPAIEAMWHGPNQPGGAIDWVDLNVWQHAWHFRRDYPSWRAGDRPGFFPIDLRPFVNHTGHATGTETMEAGRVPAVDLRYLPTGRLILSGIEFDIIDPNKNNGKSLLMLGRPMPGVTHAKDAAIVAEKAGPIPVGRKLASLAFLRAGWQASSADLNDYDAHWLFPTCRVVYDDDTWLPVDCFRVFTADYWNSGCDVQNGDRVGWVGNCPGGSSAGLIVHEWVNPYPSKVIKNLQFFVPGYEEGNNQKRSNPECQAFVAITGVEPIEQDVNYWSKRADRPPLLPPRKAPSRPGIVLQRVGDSNQLRVQQITVIDKMELTAGATMLWQWGNQTAPNDCGRVAYRKDFGPFGVVQTLEPATRLCRVELRGPTYAGAGLTRSFSYSLGRNHRVDVTVEISEDGEKWRNVGELKGLSGDADFLPVEFEPAQVKKIRLTATAAPYHENYNPGVADVRVPFDQPFFTWRLIAPADSAETKK